MHGNGLKPQGLSRGFRAPPLLQLAIQWHIDTVAQATRVDARSAVHLFQSVASVRCGRHAAPPECILHIAPELKMAVQFAVPYWPLRVH